MNLDAARRTSSSGSRHIAEVLNRLPGWLLMSFSPPKPCQLSTAIPGADAAAVVLPVRMAHAMPGQAVDIGQVGVLAPLLDVADDAEVGVPVAFIEHVERNPGSSRMCSRRLRPSSMTSVSGARAADRSSSHV